ncbi:hypothetical protein GTO91_11540 [Heliobacterium undosum]|uniref:Uncharacterized protein n=1 Tax=Heliomicrobium undosum TaxID=121734 RepID=A0A845L684_9FIRM|nr:hypothetical protein [Heliomicrobium undosum]MZP30344.1 hypothetical protein [Heliomicrobium undosum]
MPIFLYGGFMMGRRLIVNMLILALFSLSLTACNPQRPPSSGTSSETSLETSAREIATQDPALDKVFAYIKENDGHAKMSHVRVIFDQKIEEYRFLTILFKETNRNCQSLVVFTGEKNIITAPIDEQPHIAFTSAVASGGPGITTTGVRNPEHAFVFIGGKVNDDKINEMKMIFTDGKTGAVKPTEDGYFQFAQVDNDPMIVEKIHALDQNKNTIFTYPPYPPRAVNE